MASTWYSVGTLSVTSGSAVVTGTNTQFLSKAKPGFGIFIEGMGYEILSVDSATQLTLAQTYAGATKANARYSVWAITLGYGPWQEVVDLIDTFGPLRNNATLLNTQIADTAVFKDAAAASATAAAGSATAAAGSATAAATSATTANTHKNTAAGSATSATTKAGEAAASATAAATSASDANASKQAAATSATNAAGSATNANTAKVASETARNASQTAQTASEAARDQAALEKGAAQTAKTAAETAKTGAETARTGAQTAEGNALSHKNAAAASGQAAATSETQAGTYRDQAQTAASSAASDASAASLSADAAAASALNAAGHEDATETARLAAENARDMAAQYAAVTQEPVNYDAVVAALEYRPANSEGDTFTGTVAITSTADGQELLRLATERQWSFFQRGTAASTTLSLENTTGKTFHMSSGTAGAQNISFLANDTGAYIRVNGNNVYHAGNKPTKTDVGLANVDNTSDASKPVSTAQQTALNLKAPLSAPAFTGNGTMTGTFTAGTTAGHSVAIGTDGQIEIQRTGGSAYIDFKSTGAQDYEARLMAVGTNLNLQGGNLTVNGNAVYHVGNKPSKSDVGLANADNTSDANKPVSTATQNALNLKANLSGGNNFYNKQFVLGGTGTGNSSMATSATNLGELEIQGNGTGAAALCFHRPGSYAAYFGLDTDNKWKVGGWSTGAASYELFHSGHAEIEVPRLRATSSTDASLTSTGHAFQAGADTGLNVAIDNNEIMARNNGAAATLALNVDGGNVTINQQTAWHAGNFTPGDKVDKVSAARPGVNKVYRDDDDSGFHTKIWWTGTHWKWDGYNSNGTWHAPVLVNRSEVSNAADSVAWGNVSGRPTNVSSFTNNSGYINSDGRSYPRRVGGVDLNFNWAGQGGQPTWLWGGSDGSNMYVYNPSNFSVNWAGSAGNSDTVDGYHGWQLAPKSAFLCAGVATVAGGVVTRRSDKNVSSIARTGTGKYTVNVASALPGFYVVAVNSDGDAAEGYKMSAQAYNRGTGSFSLSFYHISDTPNAFDPVTFDFIVVDAGQLA